MRTDLENAPHDDEILAYWSKSRCFAIIRWSESLNSWIDDADRAAVNAPTHWSLLTDPLRNQVESARMSSRECQEYEGMPKCETCGLPIPACNRIIMLTSAIESFLLGREHSTEQAIEALRDVGRTKPEVLIIIERRHSPKPTN